MVFKNDELANYILQIFTLLSAHSEFVKMVSALKLDFSKVIDIRWAVSLVDIGVKRVSGAVMIPLHSGTNKKLVIVIGPSSVVNGVLKANRRLKWVTGSDIKVMRV